MAQAKDRKVVVTPSDVELTVPDDIRPYTTGNDQSVLNTLLSLHNQYDKYPDPNDFYQTKSILSGWMAFGQEKEPVITKKTKKVKKSEEYDYEASSYRNRVKYSGDNSWPGNIPLWRAGIEPITYRYIPNNGKYRSMKYEQRHGKHSDRGDIRNKTYKTQSEKTVVLSTEQRNFQREIQRDLQSKLTLLNTEQSSNSSAKTVSSSDIADVNRDILLSKYNNHHHHDKKHKHTPHPKTDSADNNPLNLPLCGKSISERFLERFNTRISVIDDQIKRDTNVGGIRKRSIDSSMSDNEKLNTSLGSSKKVNGSGLPHAKLQDNHVIPSSPRAEVLAQDTFSVRQLVKGAKNLIKNAKSIEENNTDEDQRLDYEPLPNPLSQISYTTSTGEIITIPFYRTGMTKHPTLLTDTEKSFYFNTMKSLSKNRPDKKSDLAASLTTLHYKPNEDKNEQDKTIDTSNCIVNNKAPMKKVKNKKSTKGKRSKTEMEKIPEDNVVDILGYHSAPLTKPDIISENTVRKSVLPRISGKGMVLSVGNCNR